MMMSLGKLLSDRAAAAVIAICLCNCLIVVGRAMVSEAAEVVGSGVGSETTLGDSDCLYETRKSCLAADAKGCIWCDLPRRCYSAARSLELGEFCTRKKPKVFVDVRTCDEIADRGTCSHDKNCLWCRSSVLDDGCFDRLEALRLPMHLYSCHGVSDS